MKTTSTNSSNNSSLDSLIEELKAREEKFKILLRRISIFMIILVFFYSLLLLVNPDKELTLNHRLAGVCYVLAFLSGAWIFRREYKKLQSKWFDRPVLAVLKETVKKYKFFSGILCQILIVPFFIGLGLFFNPTPYFFKEFPENQRSIMVMMVFWAIIIFSGSLSYLFQRYRNRDLLNDIKKTINEMEK